MIVGNFKKIVFPLVVLILSPLLLVLIWIRKKNHKNSHQLRVLIFPQMTRIGDLVCSTPVFRAIKKKYPKSFVAVAVWKNITGIIKNNPHIDEIIIYRSHNLSGFLKTIRDRNFNWSFNLNASMFSTLAAFCGLIINRVKLTREHKPAGEVMTDWLNNYKLLYRDHTYLPRRYLDMLAHMGIENSEEMKEVFATEESEEKTKEFLKQNNILETDRLVGMSITAGNKIKEWGDEKFAELAKRTSEKYGTKIIFLGGKNDEERIDKLLKSSGNKNFIKAVDFSLEDVSSIIKRLNLFISVDTGPIYIAHALKIPLIDIIGPVDPAEQPPNDGISLQVLPNPYVPPTSFVFKKRGSPEFIKKALENTSVESVREAVDTLLARKL